MFMFLKWAGKWLLTAYTLFLIALSILSEGFAEIWLQGNADSLNSAAQTANSGAYSGGAGAILGAFLFFMLYAGLSYAAVFGLAGMFIDRFRIAAERGRISGFILKTMFMLAAAFAVLVGIVESVNAGAGLGKSAIAAFGCWLLLFFITKRK